MAAGTEVEIAGRSALQLAGLLSAGLISAEALAERTLSAVSECDDPAIFTCVTAERARDEARAAGERLRQGRPVSALDGVPIAWKDLFALRGLPTTAGSRVLAGTPAAATDAAVVARLAEAGMVCVGRVNMTEFAYSGIGLNPHYGTPKNAFGRTRGHVPGGSSSGSAVAVARGLVPVAIGSDTGGSVRIPAAFNGVIGYKASTGRYSMEGVFPLSQTLDTLGVFSHSVADAVLVDAAMCGRLVPMARPARVAGVRILVPTNVVLEGCEPAVLAHFEASLDRLAAQGAVIERGPLAAFDEINANNARFCPIAPAEAYALHRQRVEGPEAAEMDVRVVNRILAAARMQLPDYIAAMQARADLLTRTAAMLGGDCLVAMPTVAHTAPLIAPLEADEATFIPVNIKTLRNTALGNYLGWCGVAVPNGMDEAGMPTSFLLSAAPGADDRLLSLALGAEAIIRGD